MIEQSSYQETMQLVHFSFKGVEYAAELSVKSLKELYKLIKLMYDTKNLNIKGNVEERQLEKRDPNLCAFHIPKAYRDKFISEINKQRIPVTELGANYNHTDDMHFYCCSVDSNKITGIIELLKDEYTVTEKAKGEKTESEIKNEADKKFGSESMGDAAEKITEGCDEKTFDKKLDERCPEVAEKIERELPSVKGLIDGNTVNLDEKGFKDYVKNAITNTYVRKIKEKLDGKAFKQEFPIENITEKMQIDGVEHFCIKLPNQDGFIVIPKDDIVPLDNGKTYACAYDLDKKITLMNYKGEMKDITIESLVKMKENKKDETKFIETNKLPAPTIKSKQR